MNGPKAGGEPPALVIAATQAAATSRSGTLSPMASIAA
jgi:hypothetical protein